jgi:hypothetical protein
MSDHSENLALIRHYCRHFCFKSMFKNIFTDQSGAVVLFDMTPVIWLLTNPHASRQLIFIYTAVKKGKIIPVTGRGAHTFVRR